MLTKTLMAKHQSVFDTCEIPPGARFIGAPYGTPDVEEYQQVCYQKIEYPDPDEQSPLLKRMINRRS